MSAPADEERLAQARDLLTTQREEALSRLHGLELDIASMTEARIDSNIDDEHDPEGATIAFERARSDALAHETMRRIGEIDAAFDRLDAGTYRICEVCREPIPWERLEARPTATTHVEHAG